MIQEETIFDSLQNLNENESSSVLLNPLTNQPFSPNYFRLLEQRKQLPVWKVLYSNNLSILLSSERQTYSEEQLTLKDIVKNNQIIIIHGETGSGKTTQIPPYLLLETDILKQNKMIGCTQPRRVAAISIAKRVSEEMDVKLGEEVGYSIRFEDITSSKTVLKYLTDGMLLREAILDPNLEKYGIMIIDEAHERTLNTDVSLALLKGILQKRKDLKLIVMSATLDGIKFQTYFDNAPIIKISGRQFPVDIIFNPEPVKDYLQAVVNKVINIHLKEEPGDILVFLNGEEEIDKAQRKINEKLDSNTCVCLPLYSSLSPAQQMKVFDPAISGNGSPLRKIVIATNIAETSITIDGIVYVVDCGFAKQNVYNPATKVESLFVSPISKASANQRAGRAGRTQKGKCYRMYTKEAYNNLQEQTYPEILRSNYASVTLLLKRLGINDLVHFDLMDPPPPQALMRSLEDLIFLGALTFDGELTEIGKMMADLPLDPHLAKIVIESPKFKCSQEILSIVSMLSVPTCFYRPFHLQKEADSAHSRFYHTNGDHLTLLNVYHAYKLSGDSKDWCYDNFISYRALLTADNIRSQLVGWMKKFRLELISISPKQPQYYENIRKALLVGFFMQATHLQKNGTYLTLNHNGTKSNQVLIHPSSPVSYKKPEWCFYSEFVLTTKNYIRTVTEIKGEWLLEIAPHYYSHEYFSKSLSFSRLLQLSSRSKKH